jgi:hypothetical protein
MASVSIPSADRVWIMERYLKLKIFPLAAVGQPREGPCVDDLPYRLEILSFCPGWRWADAPQRAGMGWAPFVPVETLQVSAAWNG